PKLRANAVAGIASDLAQYLRSSDAALPASGESFHQASGSFAKLDPLLQSGIRGKAASAYETLQSGNSGADACNAMLPLFDGILAVAGKRRTETVGDLVFLP